MCPRTLKAKGKERTLNLRTTLGQGHKPLICSKRRPPRSCALRAVEARVLSMSEFCRIDSAALFTRTVNSSTVLIGVLYTICFNF
jgi:hypothetical protein